MKSINVRNRGLADVAFILIIVGACSLIGMLTVKMSQKPDSPVEQAMEDIIRNTSGQNVDFSAQLKKDAQGHVVEETVIVQKPIVVDRAVVVKGSDGKAPLPTSYDK